MLIDDIKSEVDSLYERVRKLETHDPLGNASVSRGSTRFLGNESLKVIGSALVSGWLIITGTLKVVGTLLIEGVTTLTGPLNVNGGWGINGNGGINGTWIMNGAGTIIGAVTQTGIYTLTAGGQFVIAGSLPMTVGVQGGLPGVYFPGGSLNSASDRIRMVNGSSQIGAAAGSAVLLFGANGVLANATGVALNGIGTTTSAANVFLNASGYLQQVSSAERYKMAIEDMPLPDGLRTLKAKSWFDSGDAERVASLVGKPRPYTQAQQEASDATSALRRVPGVIAEQVQAAGGTEFVTFDKAGHIAGVAYDRLGVSVALDAQGRITELERTVSQQAETIAALDQRLVLLER
jgi:hypothetical protein